MMGKTRRAYNKDPLLWVGTLTPEEYQRMKHAQVCCGKYKTCKDHKVKQRKKTHKQKEVQREIKGIT